MSCHEQYKHFPPEWCPGCGNFDLLECLQQALCDLKLAPNDFIMVAGIGLSAQARLFSGMLFCPRW